ncbi:MAG: VanZ family protein [Lachnospiraceae bacterium]|nr:VanZ family protein [Lachnospiraceae bacterium]
MNTIRVAIGNGFPVIVLGAIAYLVFRTIRRRHWEVKPSWRKEALWFAFAMYVLMLLSITIVPSWKFLPDSNGVTRLYVFTSLEKPHINLIPFHSIRQFLFGNDARVDNFRSAGVMNLIGNALLYCPFGVIGVLAFGEKERIIRKLFLNGLVLCLAVEIVQYFVGRSPDIDDVVLNMLGLIIGLCIGRFIQKLLAAGKS